MTDPYRTNPTKMHGIEELIDDPDDDTEEVCNISSMVAKFEIDNTKIKLKPGDRIRIHKQYTRKQQMAKDRDPVASAIENITGGRVVPSSDRRVPRQAVQSNELTS